jgi:hypothetical protein
MSETPISPLRQRMIDDMHVRNFGEKTQKDYIRHVKTFLNVPRPLTGRCDGGRPAPLPGPSEQGRNRTSDDQWLGRRIALLLPCDA